jgi:phage tail sheath protein FI
MPVTPTYPGVYVEEIPSGVRTIVGVATSITAFIGRTLRGPTNDPTTINSFGDFERQFGGLSRDFPIGYAVRDFFLNGGSQAIIVRVTSPNTNSGKKAYDAAKSVADAVAGATDVNDAKAKAKAASDAINNDQTKIKAEKDAAQAVLDAVNAAAGQAGATLESVKAEANKKLPTRPAAKATLSLKADAGKLILEAVSEGRWGNALSAHVDYDNITATTAERYKPLTENDLFNLTLRDLNTGNTERFLCVTVVPNHPRSVDLVLKNGSGLARVSGSLPQVRPQNTDDALGLKTALQGLKSAGEAQNATEEAKKKGKDAGEKLKLLDKPFDPTQEWRYVMVDAAGQGADGGSLTANDIVSGEGLQDNMQGLYALDKADLFNLLCIPPDTVDGTLGNDVYQAAMQYCADHRAVLIVDPPADWGANRDTAAAAAKAGLDGLGLSGVAARNAALFFPRVVQSDPTRDGQLDTFAPCGIVAGVMARTDVQRGVWKAPAGLDAAINGVQGLQANLNDAENGMLNPLGINCLRAFPVYGRVVWGARTLRGADQLADEYKYIPVRRLALFIEESLYRGLKWVVFEPNDEPLWAQIRLNVGAFMHNLFRQGAFQGTTPRDAYFVKCDKETTTQNDINLGIVNIVVGFAPLKPAEFVIIKLQQMAGQIQV